MLITRQCLFFLALIGVVAQACPRSNAEQHQRSLNPFSDLSRSKSIPAKKDTQKKEWTILIYIQACNNLESFAHKNLRGMMRVGSNDKLNILVELHKPGDKSWRYRIDQNNCVVDEVVARAPNAKTGDEVVDAARWAISSYPSEKFALIFWNHGLGVVDPPWSVIEPCYMKSNVWRGTDITKSPDAGMVQAKNLSRATTKQLADDRGILFDDERRSYLTNTDMRKALRTISVDLLGGKKVDVVGMDACLMAMLEVPYQFKEYAHYFVASQEFEFAQGWSYGPLMARIANGRVSAQDFCHAVVETYQDYFKPKTSYFTQSSINIETLDTLHNNIDNVCLLLQECYKRDERRTRILVNQARCQCLSFSMPEYIDLHSFFDELYKLIDKKQRNPNSSPAHLMLPQVDSQILNLLKDNLDKGRRLIVNKVVTKNTTGKYLDRAKGLSIYFPQKNIDSSYLKTEFANKSQWLPFVAKHLDK